MVPLGCQFDKQQKKAEIDLQRNWKIRALQQPKGLKQPQPDLTVSFAILIAVLCFFIIIVKVSL